jgi:hypothetical protein
MAADLFFCGPDGVNLPQVDQLIAAVGLRPVRIGDLDAVDTLDGIARLVRTGPRPGPRSAPRVAGTHRLNKKARTREPTSDLATARLAPEVIPTAPDHQ